MCYPRHPWQALMAEQQHFDPDHFTNMIADELNAFLSNLLFDVMSVEQGNDAVHYAGAERRAGMYCLSIKFDEGVWVAWGYCVDDMDHLSFEVETGSLDAMRGILIDQLRSIRYFEYIE